ncbi:MAG: site-specific DNA-methyltransferase [Candidatus Omnitrophica bacterium]|nr:site-specific DNA-methyltransferase [Candidatus Omnitrophota bacterium]
MKGLEVINATTVNKSISYLGTNRLNKIISRIKEHHLFEDSEKNIYLYKADCSSILAQIPENSIDMIFADPPYFGNQSGLIIERNDGHADTFDTQKARWAYSRSLDYQFKFHYTWLKEAQRILKEGSTIWITGTYHSIGVVNVVLQDLGFKILNDIILHKRNAPPNFTGSCFRAVTETMLWAKKNFNGKTKFNYRAMKELNNGTQMKSLWEYWAEKNPFRHPATKQPIVLEYAILAGSNEDDLILDPFAGSGTTGFVAQGLNRQCIMIEIDSSYCQLIKDRIEGKYGEFKRKTKTKRKV